MARGSKFRIKEVEGLYYLCSKNKDTVQLCGYCAVDRRLFFAYAKSRFSLDPAQMIIKLLPVCVGQPSYVWLVVSLAYVNTQNNPY